MAVVDGGECRYEDTGGLAAYVAVPAQAIAGHNGSAVLIPYLHAVPGLPLEVLELQCLLGVA
ncbi:MAG TPA: hypothetical protein DDY16_05485 [Tenacibaculum sp.]|nr:hypothetical protein [Tenacibaculum sp.]